MKLIKKTIQSIKGKFSEIKASLTHINDREPLSKLSLVVIIFLDIFILITLFQGLDDHTSQLTSPGEYIPEICREIFITQKWTKADRISKLSNVVTSYNSSAYTNEKVDDNDIHPLCQTCIGTIKKIKKNDNIKSLFNKREQLDEHFSNLEGEIKSLKTLYDTWLLEKISDNNNSMDKNNIHAIKQNIFRKRNEANSLINQITSIDATLNNNSDIALLFQTIDKIDKNSRENLKADLENIKFWFPAKKLLMQLIFLLPLFVIFYLWTSKSKKKGSGLQTLISSHLLVITFIPVFLKISEAIYDIIPKKILKMLWDLLISLKLVAVWHYFIILLSIGFALLTIYIIQKRIFNRDKLIERRIIKGYCINCGKKIPRGTKACPLCGFKQFIECSMCGEETFVHGKYCKNCGNSQTGE